MIHLSWIINGSDHDPIYIYPLTGLLHSACKMFRVVVLPHSIWYTSRAWT
ncbi:hypothetical protein HanHA300_Chr12g0447771 [Helianthus annuus]|nr:hypothetical protein HanHA300_Chr12g0447771 [Helianthus annuus]KAJ0505687.1 hypothetical protein HanHA89_Chr12g0473281 [Helianthus annuus]KAJ0675356.1 hypothetical protein HanLR1_Chr12g0450221 [Helianthus annuus]KAJ0678652.1 hypothetical protein HanOQP8_Chr12g0450291 [Helianthus annuus]